METEEPAVLDLVRVEKAERPQPSLLAQVVGHLHLCLSRGTI